MIVSEVESVPGENQTKVIRPSPVKAMGKTGRNNQDASTASTPL